MTTSTNATGNQTIQPADRLQVGPSAYSRGGSVHFGRYGSGEISLEVVDEAGETQYVATVALVRYGGPHPGDHAVWLKGWSESEGVPEALLAAGIETLTGRRFPAAFADALHAELTERALAALNSKHNGLTGAVHREIDELVRFGVIAAQQAEELKQVLTSRAIEQHDQDGMSIRDMIDMYRDLIALA